MISVIMLTYNREALVGRAIESLLAQTYRDFEFIIVDNGSTDRSGQIAEEYAKKDPRIQVIHRAQGNIGAGRNTGLDTARGEYIAFIDDDDFVEPTYLEYLHGLAEEHHADIAVCGSWREVNGVQQPKYVFDGIFSYTGEEAVAEMLRREKFNSANPTKLISSRIFESLRYFDVGKYDDIRTVYRQFALAESVVVSGKPLYTFVRHEDNNSTGTTQGEVIPAGQIAEYLDAFRERTCWLSERFPGRADYWLYTELSYALSMYDKTTNTASRERLKQLLLQYQDDFRAAKRFYTKRDQELLQLHGGEFA